MLNALSLRMTHFPTGLPCCIYVAHLPRMTSIGTRNPMVPLRLRRPRWSSLDRRRLGQGTADLHRKSCPCPTVPCRGASRLWFRSARRRRSVLIDARATYGCDGVTSVETQWQSIVTLRRSRTATAFMRLAAIRQLELEARGHGDTSPI